MSVLDTVLSIVAPHICVACRVEGAVLCKSCALTLPTLPSICYVCAKATKNHEPCTAHKARYSPSCVYISAEYNDAVKRLIKAYKFDFKRSAAKDIAFFLHNTLPFLGKDTVVSFVPATGGHIRERGFNHIYLIAKELAALQKLQCAQSLLRVTTTTQKGADKKTRKKTTR